MREEVEVEVEQDWKNNCSNSSKKVIGTEEEEEGCSSVCCFGEEGE